MQNQSKKRLIVFALCFCFILVSLLSQALLITHAEHDCTGKQCSVCVHNNNMQNLIKQLGMAVAGFVFTFAVLFSDSLALKIDDSHIFMKTPITMKVKMNN